MNKLSTFFSIFQSNPLLLLTVFIIGGLCLCILCVLLGRQIGRIEMNRQIKSQRKDAVKRSKSVVTGQVFEQIAPFLPNFPCNPKDVQFIGKPIDFIGFCGNDEDDRIEEILFIEVKTGSSTLSSREKSLKDAVINHRIRYIEYHPES